MYTKEELTPPALALFDEVKSRLPVTVGRRLKSNRKVTTHGSRQVFNFDIWDSAQNDVLDRKHFKYCLAYDPHLLNDGRHDGFFHLWLTTVRIYRERETIKPMLEREIPRVAPKGFHLDFVEDRAISCGKVFDWPRDLSKLGDLLAHDYVRLIGAIHPVLIPVIDQFSLQPMASGERRAVVAKRGAIPIERKGALAADRVRDYSRSVPKSWDPEILARTGHCCPLCQVDLRSEPYHIDHIVPFSHGGKSVLDNLQALCAPCNLRKGNRVGSAVEIKKGPVAKASNRVVRATTPKAKKARSSKPPSEEHAARPKVNRPQPSNKVEKESLGFLSRVARFFR